MNTTEILDWCLKYIENHDYLIFPDEILSMLDSDIAKIVADKFSKTTLMKLPPKEIKFFEWLKKEDRKIWDDLWNAEGEDPYIVSINFLPLLINESRGFPICDLIDNDNYYFTNAHMLYQESGDLIVSVKNMYMDKKSLTIEQTLVLEISIAPIDIWRFAYRYGLSIERAKKAVSALVGDNVLVHIKQFDHLSNFIEI